MTLPTTTSGGLISERTQVLRSLPVVQNLMGAPDHLVGWYACVVCDPHDCTYGRMASAVAWPGGRARGLVLCDGIPHTRLWLVSRDRAQPTTAALRALRRRAADADAMAHPRLC